MMGGFGMNGKNVGPGLLKGFQKFFGFYDHKMHVERNLSAVRNGLYDIGPDSDIGDKAPVHYVEVKIIGQIWIELGQFGFEISKVC